MSRSHSQANDIFFAEQMPGKEKERWKVMWAKSGRTDFDSSSKQTHLVLENGKIYEGSPGQANYKVYQFSELRSPIPLPKITVSDDVRTLTNRELLPWHNASLDKLAELQWRLSIPMMVFVLTFLALPLSKVNARSGKYARLVPALLLYILYANLMFMGRDWLVQGITPWWLGLWWLHGSFFCLGGILFYWQRKA